MTTNCTDAPPCPPSFLTPTAIIYLISPLPPPLVFLQSIALITLLIVVGVGDFRC